MPRVLLYSTVPIIVKGFAAVLSSTAEFELVSVCIEARQLPQAIAVTNPDVIVIDIDQAVAFEHLVDLRNSGPAGARLILWTHSITPEVAYQTMRLGVRGILRKTLGIDVMLKCLRTVAAGECWFEEALTASFLEMKTVRLSRRESQLISLVSQGMRNREIAGALLIAEQTVKIYLSRLFRKVGAKDRFELALYGLRNSVTGQLSLFSQMEDVSLEPVNPPRRPPLLVVPEERGARPRARRAPA